MDTNLRRLRGKSGQDLEMAILLELDRPPANNARPEREARVLDFALRNVDMHGWDAAITPDASAIRLDGGSVALDIALGATVSAYIADGA
ncbi:MAG: hypothetical protein F2832_05290 [Actinobacteria bacterium]|nr:hypothetical protein [Actinomycetota bacterium]